jgi:uncharacterized membrane protein YqaE (UPF0057 family)
MRYFWAFVFPPIAVAMCGKPFQFLLNILLTAALYFPGMLHSICVVGKWERQRHREELIAIAGSARR